MSFKDNLKKYRKLNKMTQADLAQAVGAGVHTVKMWESGKHEPNVRMVVKICELFGISAEELCSEEIPQPENTVPLDSDKVALIEEIMKMDEKTFRHLKTYYEFLKNKSGVV